MMNQNDNMEPLVDLTDTDADAGFDALPAGPYMTQVSNAEVKTTKAGNGRYISVELEVTEPKAFSGRKVWDNFNIQNPSEDATKIGKANLKGFMVAAGHKNPDVLRDVNELIGLRVVATLIIKKDPNWGEGNQVKKYEPATTAEVSQATQIGSPAQQDIPDFR